jgi:CRP/FNR family cyclic AMP-dependent transcriptional regulator
MVTVQDIKGFGLFSGLTESEVARLAVLCHRRNYEKNATIFDPGSPTEEMFIVEGGNDAIQIEISLGAQEGKIVIHTLSKGEAFGWAALGSRHIRTATARCLETVSVIAINGKSLMDLLEENNRIGYIVMKNLADIINTRLAYTSVVFRHEILKCRKTVRV